MTKEQVQAGVKPLMGSVLVRLIMETGELIKGTTLVKPDSQITIEPFVEIIAVGPVNPDPTGKGTSNGTVMKPGDYALVKGRAQMNIFRIGTEDYSFISEYDLDAVISEEIATEISSTQRLQKMMGGVKGLEIIN